MAKAKSVIAEKITKEELEAISKIAMEKLDKMEVKKGRKNKNEEFLNDIKEVIKKALDKEIPFTEISKLVKELYNLQISANIIKYFAINNLSYVVKNRKDNKEEAKENKTTKEVKKEENNDGRKTSNFEDL